MIRCRAPDGATAVATPQGAHLVSWTLPTGEEMLFLSERSVFEPGHAIRGGIPVCFPQFAERGPLVKHGFARIRPWTFLGTAEVREGARMAFALESSPETLAIWPHEFRLELVVTVGGERLQVELRVANTGAAAFDFSAALHTYLRVSDATLVRLEGLDSVVTAAQPIDRIFFGAPDVAHLHDGRRRLRIEQRGFADTVVWNPGCELAARMPDMAPDGYLRMLCVEAAAVEPRIVVEPGGSWSGSQSLSVEPS